MSTEADEEQNDYELSYNVDDIELDLLYQDEQCEGGKSSQQSQSQRGHSRDRDKNDKKVPPKKLPRKPDRPLFRPRQLWVRGRGRGRGSIRGLPRGRGNYHRIDPRRKPGDSKRRDRSRSEEDLRVQLESLKDRGSRSGKRSRSKENEASSRSRENKSGQQYRENKFRSTSRERRDRNDPKRSQSKENELKIRHAVLNNEKFELKSGPSGSKDRRSRSKSNDSNTTNKETQMRNKNDSDGTSRNKYMVTKIVKEKSKSNYDLKNYNAGTKECESRNDNRGSISPANDSRNRDKRAKSNEHLKDKGGNSKSHVMDTSDKDRRSRSRELDLNLRSNTNNSKVDKRSKSRSRDSRSKSRRSKSKDRRHNTSESNVVNRGRSISHDRTSRSRDRRDDSSRNNARSDSRDKRSRSRRKMRSKSRGRRSLSRGRRSRSTDKLSASRNRRSVSRSRRSRSRGRRSASRGRCSDNRRRCSASRGRRSASRGRRSASRGRRSASRGRRSASRGRRSTSRGRRSASRGRRSTSRRRRSTSRGRRSVDRRRRSSSRGRRSHSRGRRSRSRCRRSRSRPRRSRSKCRRSRSRNGSRKRTRKSDSRSSTSSRSSSRRRLRAYSRSRSKSSDVVVYKPRIELIDVDKYDENRDRGILAPLYSDPLLTTCNIGQIPVRPQFSETPPVAGNSFVHRQYDESQPPPPPGIGPFDSRPVLEHEFGCEQPPPAPFISSHVQPGPQPFVARPPPPQIFTSQPSIVHHTPPVLIQRTISPVPFHGVPHAQSEEFGGFQHNLPGEFVSEFPGGVHHERFQQPQAPPPPSFNLVTSSHHPPEDSWNAGHQKQLSSFSLYDLEPSPPPVPQPPKVNAASKKSGVEEERQNQKQTLVIQRDQYLQKNAQLQKELTRLKEQRTELLQENLSETEELLKENTKLQNEVTQRLKAVENVIEMLSGLIKKDLPQIKKSDSFSSRKESWKNSPHRSHHSPEVKKCRGDEGRSRDCKRSSKDRDRTSPRRDRTPLKRNTRSPHSHDKTDKKEDDAVIVLEPSPPPLILPTYNRARSPLKLNLTEVQTEKNKSVDISRTEKSIATPSMAQNQVNLVHYDPELHWCSLCNVFPKTAIDYLNHLHTAKHKQQTTVLKIDANPWHSDEPSEPQPPIIKNAPTKRIPIRGVQFLVPATGWYCRLCKTWVGDMHCAQDHLKGRKHTTNYAEYIAQNPHWEVDWLSDRTKSFERTSENLSRLRDKEESLTLNPSCGLESEKAKFSALSDTLLAVLAQQNKRSRQSSSSSSSSSEGDDRRKHKRTKKKKSKKRKRKDVTPEKTSPSKVEKPHVPHYRQRNKDDDDEDDEALKKSDMISSWMDCDKLDPPIAIRLKSKPQQTIDDSNTTKLQDEVNMNVEMKGDNRRVDTKVISGLFISPKKEGDKISDKVTDKSKEDDKSSYRCSDRNKLEKPSERYSDRSRDGDRPSDRCNERNREGGKYCDKNKDMNKSVDLYSELYREGDKNNERQNERNKESDKSFAKSKDSLESSSRWKSTRDPLHFIRRETRGFRDQKQNNDQTDERPMAKKVEQAKKRLVASRLEENDLKLNKKMSPSQVFHRPDSDRESPEPVIPDRKDKCSKNDKPQGKLWFPSSKDDDEDEEEKTPFERQTDESVSKKKIEIKKPQQFVLPKTKLPFIGRMPILKKRTIEFKCEEPKEKKNKQAEKILILPNIAKTVEGADSRQKTDQSSVNIASKENSDANADQKSVVQNAEVKAPVVTTGTKTKFSEDNLAEQDMEIANDDQDDIILVEETSPPEGQTDLHPDFQDALDLLFPEANDGVSGCFNRNEIPQIDHSNAVFGPEFDRQFKGNIYDNDVPPLVLRDSSKPALSGSEASAVDSAAHVKCPSLLGSGLHSGVVPVDPQSYPTSVGLQVCPSSEPQECPIGPPDCPPIGPQDCPSGGSQMSLIAHQTHPPPPIAGQGCPPFRHPGCSSVIRSSIGLDISSDISVMVRQPPPMMPSNIGRPIPGPPPGPPPVGPFMGSSRMGTVGGSSMVPPPIGPHPCLPRPVGPVEPLERFPLYPFNEDHGKEPTSKRKNAPSQRMRRHMQKKRAEEAKSLAQSSSGVEKKKSKYEGMDLSDLAMLGIDEDDSIIT